MKTFKKQFRDLPWAEPSVGLRHSLFGEVGPASPFRMYRLIHRVAGKAALWLLVGSIIGYCVGRGQRDAVASAPSPDDVIVVVTGAETHLFNQTNDIQEAIPGPWVLSVEPEGDTQG